jgi:hypothetical protein
MLATEASAPLDDQGFSHLALGMLVSLTDECHALKLPNASMHTRKTKKKAHPGIHILLVVFAKQHQSSI